MTVPVAPSAHPERGWSERAIFHAHRRVGLKVTGPSADVTGTMAEADRTPSRVRPSVPSGLLDALATPPLIRLDEVARARQRAADRAYDDGEVVVGIAEHLLSLSAR